MSLGEHSIELVRGEETTTIHGCAIAGPRVFAPVELRPGDVLRYNGAEHVVGQTWPWSRADGELDHTEALVEEVPDDGSGEG